MKRYIVVLLGLAGWLTACDSLKQEVDPDLVNAGSEKLVVTCFLAPQDTILVANVALSRPVLGENVSYDTRRKDAVITLSEGSRSVRFKIREGNVPGGFYYYVDPKEFPIEAGKTYTLNVGIADGRKVQAKCTVPHPVIPDDIVLDSALTLRNGFSGKEFLVRLRWLDPSGEKNFYRVGGIFKYRAAPINPRDTTTIRWQSNLIDFRRNRETRDLIDDRGNDGTTLASPRGKFNIGNNDNQTTLAQFLSVYQNAELEIDLLHTDENYYRYHEAVFRQDQTGGNPFAEPILIPTNIEGGLGCFGAYNRSTRSFTLK
ncbi:DUF4249 domain-containing protein [Larkinella soli]|uniref:DUF4249 domain-containing protein n=1 Tax=Larkinella soli TaxID=1770527 RepID=UPI000FFC88FC|nr:DUF4249 domain-containing protein [Larkinella soli]